MPTTWRSSSGPIRAFLRTGDRPTLIVVHSHIGYGAPHKQDSPEAHGEPLGEAGGAADQAVLWLRPGTRTSWFPMACASISPNSSARAARAQRRMAGDVPALSRSSIPIWPTQIDCISAPRLPRGMGDGVARVSRRARPDFRHATHPGKVLNAVAERIPWIIGGAADLSPSTKTRLTFESAGDFQAGWPTRQLSRPEHAFRRARARDVRRGQRHDIDRTARVRVGLPDLHRLCARRDPAGLADGPAGAAHLDA